VETNQLKNKIDKSSFSVVSLFDRSDEKDFWQSKSSSERLEAVEILRQRVYDYNPFTTRLQRVLSITKLP
jgi:hypothetical protein